MTNKMVHHHPEAKIPRAKDKRRRGPENEPVPGTFSQKFSTITGMPIPKSAKKRHVQSQQAYRHAKAKVTLPTLNLPDMPED
jgi:hypothetical protein